MTSVLVRTKTPGDRWHYKEHLKYVDSKNLHEQELLLYEEYGDKHRVSYILNGQFLTPEGCYQVLLTAYLLNFENELIPLAAKLSQEFNSITSPKFPSLFFDETKLILDLITMAGYGLTGNSQGLIGIDDYSHTMFSGLLMAHVPFHLPVYVNNFEQYKGPKIKEFISCADWYWNSRVVEVYR